MPDVLGSTLLAPALLWRNFVFAEWSRTTRWLPAIVPSSIAVARGHSFEGAFALVVLIAVTARPMPRFNRSSLAALIALSILVLLDWHSARPRGFLFKNALTAGQALALFADATGRPWLGFAAGFTGTRSSLAIMAWEIHPSRGYFVALGGAAAGLICWYFLQKSMLPGNSGHVFERLDIAGSIARRAVLNAGAGQGWLGAGFGNFPGEQRPHNAFLSIWAQCGLLSIPILVTAAWHAKRIHPLNLLPLFPALWLADWLFSSAGGIGMLAVYLGYAQERRPWPGYEVRSKIDKAKCQAARWIHHRRSQPRVIDGAPFQTGLDDGQL